MSEHYAIIYPDGSMSVGTSLHDIMKEFSGSAMSETEVADLPQLARVRLDVLEFIERPAAGATIICSHCGERTD